MAIIKTIEIKSFDVRLVDGKLHKVFANKTATLSENGVKISSQSFVEPVARADLESILAKKVSANVADISRLALERDALLMQVADLTNQLEAFDTLENSSNPLEA